MLTHRLDLVKKKVYDAEDVILDSYDGSVSAVRKITVPVSNLYQSYVTKPCKQLKNDVLKNSYFPQILTSALFGLTILAAPVWYSNIEKTERTICGASKENNVCMKTLDDRVQTQTKNAQGILLLGGLAVLTVLVLAPKVENYIDNRK